jgi:hypothetical protein
MRARLVLSAAGMVVALAAARPAHADDKAEAEHLASGGEMLALEGRETGDRAKLRGAIAMFKDANELYAKSEYLCAVGVAYLELADAPRAQVFLSRCLQRLVTDDPALKQQFQAALGEVEDTLRATHAPVDITTVPDGATLSVSKVLAEDEVFTAPLLVWLGPGSYQVTATAPGREPTSATIEVTSTARQTIRITLPERPVKPPPERPPVEPVVAAPKPGALAWGLAIGGGVALAGGVVMHLVAYDTRSELATLSGDAYDDLEPTFQKQRLATFALYGVGAIAASVGTYLLLKDRTPERRPSSRAAAVGISPSGDGDGALVWLSWVR